MAAGTSACRRAAGKCLQFRAPRLSGCSPGSRLNALASTPHPRLHYTMAGAPRRYVSHLDTVPELPLFDSFRQVPHGMWLRDDLVLLQARAGQYRSQSVS